MSHLLEANRKPALIIKTWIIFIAHTDDLGWNIQPARTDVLSKPGQDFQQAYNVRPGQILCRTTDSIQIT